MPKATKSARDLAGAIGDDVIRTISLDLVDVIETRGEQWTALVDATRRELGTTDDGIAGELAAYRLGVAVGKRIAGGRP
jgi:hypothetical protein